MLKEKNLHQYLETKFQELNQKISKLTGEQSKQSQWLITDEVSTMLSVTKRTIYNWNNSGKLKPNNKFGKLLYRREDIENLLNND